MSSTLFFFFFFPFWFSLPSHWEGGGLGMSKQLCSARPPAGLNHNNPTHLLQMSPIWTQFLVSGWDIISYSCCFTPSQLLLLFYILTLIELEHKQCGLFFSDISLCSLMYLLLVHFLHHDHFYPLKTFKAFSMLILLKRRQKKNQTQVLRVLTKLSGSDAMKLNVSEQI